MIISDVLSLDRVSIFPSMYKADLLDKMILQLSQTRQVQDCDALKEGVFHRESLMSTGIGMGIAVPHVRLPSVKSPVMAAAVCKGPVLGYESLDGKEVRLVFMIAAGKGQHAEHLRLLASITRRLRDQTLREALIDTLDTQKFYHMLMTGEVT